MVKFEYTVDDETFTTSEKELTPRQILTEARFDPTKVYLILTEGDHDVSYRDKPDEVIHMHEKMIFITAKLGPTPVSQ